MNERPYKVFVDPGHGGTDPGAVNKKLGLYESQINLQLSRRFSEHVFAGDYLFEVFLTRDADIDVSLQKRCDLANAKKADLFLSFHCNAATDPAAHGFEVWTSIGKTKADDAATMIFEGLGLAMPDSKGRPDYDDGDPDKESNFYVLRNTTMPAVLIEFMFISNEKDDAMLEDPAIQAAVVKGLAEAVECFLEG